jgi:hypothetical protein
MDRRTFAWSLVLLPLQLRAADDPEVTEDGLVRVPSSRKVGVYRAPDVPFARYRRISIGDIPVAFRKNWVRNNPQLKESDRERLRGELVRMYREELIAELVERGGYALTDATDADVLHVDPAIIDLDISAPDAGTVPGSRTFVRSAGSMQLKVELRDAASGVTVARIIDYETARDDGHLQLANSVTNADDLRELFASVARYTRAALDVAKTHREP